MPNSKPLSSDSLRELAEEYREIHSDLKGSESDYNRGLAEGARSAAVDLERLLERSGGQA